VTYGGRQLYTATIYDSTYSEAVAFTEHVDERVSDVVWCEVRHSATDYHYSSQQTAMLLSVDRVTIHQKCSEATVSRRPSLPRSNLSSVI